MKIIETERLILREYRQTDFEKLYEILSDQETMKYYIKPYDEIGTQRWIDWCINSYKDNKFGLWAIELKDENVFIGDCGISLQNIDNEILPEVGYHINKKYWRNGYAKEAAKAVLEWGFQNTSYNEFYSYMNYQNIGSYKTAESIGMVKVKEYSDEFEKLFVYKITRNDYKK